MSSAQSRVEPASSARRITSREGLGTLPGFPGRRSSRFGRAPITRATALALAGLLAGGVQTTQAAPLTPEEKAAAAAEKEAKKEAAAKKIAEAKEAATKADAAAQAGITLVDRPRMDVPGKAQPGSKGDPALERLRTTPREQFDRAFADAIRSEGVEILRVLEHRRGSKKLRRLQAIFKEANTQFNRDLTRAQALLAGPTSQPAT